MVEGDTSVLAPDAAPQVANGNSARPRHRWGPIPGSAPIQPQPPTADGSTAPAPKRRRKSRWETAEPTPAAHDAVPDPTQPNTNPTTALVVFPSEIVLSSGLKINLPPALTGRHPSGDPEVVKLHQELLELERKLRNGTVEVPPERERSPSPEPVYDANGVRQNTREQRHREKQSRRRTQLIEELIKRDPTYKPPSDYKPEKKWRKLPIPYKEYPDYNFIGLIIGPRGNTQKRMQSETNTRIAIRGRGSVKDGALRQATYDYGEDEDLHVLVVGDRQEDVDKAAAMVERLLQPMDEEMNEHKQRQLRELALINGTLKDEDLCAICGEPGHLQVDCPKKALDVYRLPDAIQLQVDEQYARDLAKINPAEAGKNEEEYRSFLAELGGTDPRAVASMAASLGTTAAAGRGGSAMDAMKLWVGNLAPTVDSAALRALFEPHGHVTLAEVKTDADGVSRGFGFVHFTDETQARAASEALNGHVMEGKSITVRRKGEDASERAAGRRIGLGAGPPPRPEDDLPPDCRMYVGHIPHHVDEFVLRREFERFGAVISTRIIMDRESGRPKGYGFVAMADPAAAQTAIAALDGYPGLDPTLRPIVVRKAGEPGASRQRPPPHHQQQQHPHLNHPHQHHPHHHHFPQQQHHHHPPYPPPQHMMMGGPPPPGGAYPHPPSHHYQPYYPPPPQFASGGGVDVDGSGGGGAYPPLPPGPPPPPLLADPSASAPPGNYYPPLPPGGGPPPPPPPATTTTTTTTTTTAAAAAAPPGSMYGMPPQDPYGAPIPGVGMDPYGGMYGAGQHHDASAAAYYGAAPGSTDHPTTTTAPAGGPPPPPPPPLPAAPAEGSTDGAMMMQPPLPPPPLPAAPAEGSTDGAMMMQPPLPPPPPPAAPAEGSTDGAMMMQPPLPPPPPPVPGIEGAGADGFAALNYGGEHMTAMMMQPPLPPPPPPPVNGGGMNMDGVNANANVKAGDGVLHPPLPPPPVGVEAQSADVASGAAGQEQRQTEYERFMAEMASNMP